MKQVGKSFSYTPQKVKRSAAPKSNKHYAYKAYYAEAQSGRAERRAFKKNKRALKRHLAWKQRTRRP